MILHVVIVADEHIPRDMFLGNFKSWAEFCEHLNWIRFDGDQFNKCTMLVKVL